jgi:hypothetical protein
LTGDTLHYVMHMQTIKVPRLALHVEARLERQPRPPGFPK